MERRRGFQVFDERGDLARSCAPNPYSLLPAGNLVPAGKFRAGFRISDVQSIVFGDEDSARSAELIPLRYELTFLAEDFNSIVQPVRNEQPPLGIETNGMRLVKISWAGSFLSKGSDELSVFRKNDNAAIGSIVVPV